MTDAMLFAPLYRQQDEEAAEEERQERIADLVPAIVERLIRDDDFCERAASELFGDPVESLMQSAGAFFARYRAADTERGEAEAGHALYRDLLPYMEAAARDAAQTEAAAEADRLDSLAAQDAAEAWGEP